MIKKPYELGLKKGIGYSLRRYYVDSFFYFHRKDFANASHVLDLGGEKENKRGQFNLYEHATKITNINLTAKKNPDVLGDAAQIPVKDRTFDVAICAELLEHVRDPIAVLKEIKRTLKKNGKAYITVPFMFPVHADPHDYGRYTNTFWKENLSELGFKNISISPQGTFVNVFVDMMRMFVYNRVKSKYLKFGFYLPIRMLQRLSFGKDKDFIAKKDKFHTAWTTGYAIVAQKK